MPIRFIVLLSLCAFLQGCSSVQPRSAQVAATAVLSTTALPMTELKLTLTDERDAPLTATRQVHLGYRIGDDMMSPGPVQALRSELWRAVERHPKRQQLEVHLTVRPIALTEFEAAIVGRSLADAAVRSGTPAVDLFDHLARHALDRASGASESSLLVKVKLDGYTHYAFRKATHLGPVAPDFLAALVREAAEWVVSSMARDL